MSHYPFRHSTFFTAGDSLYTSELPPMNSMEDLLQDMFMRERNTIYITFTKPKTNGLTKMMASIKNWKKGLDSSFLTLPRSVRRSTIY